MHQTVDIKQINNRQTYGGCQTDKQKKDIQQIADSQSENTRNRQLR